MITCPDCGAQHYPGTLFCNACGGAVHPAAQAHVAQARRVARATTPPSATARRRPETLPPPEPDRELPELQAHIPHRRHTVALRAAVVNIGRADPEAGFAPELDLTPFDGLERGVSRRHATIQWAEGGFVLIDQHSGNGTWLEGARLVAGYAYQLPPQATVRFGDLVVQLMVEGS